MARKSGFDTKLGIAAGVLAVGMTAAVSAAHLGELGLGAGDVMISMSRGETGILMELAPRTCPPNCGFDFNWRPLTRPGQ